MAHRVTLAATKVVAVKLFPSKQQSREMFLEEARLSMQLNNANIVQVFDAGEVNGEYFMAMEWIDGANLAELQAALWEVGRAIPIDVAMYVVGEILRALDYAHNVVLEDAATIVHRDVSPANIMLSSAGEVKLTDFGIARLATDETSGLYVKGKRRYMAPEQFRGCSKAGTVDLYSIGAVLHEMLDGFKFRGNDTDVCEILGMAVKGVRPELADPTRTSEQLDSLRRRLLAPDASRRPSSARQAVQQLWRCPGYRNAAHELEALVRWYRGLEPGDSGFRSPRFTPPTEARPDGEMGDTSDSRCGASETEDRTRPRRPLRITRSQQLAAAIVLALSGLGAGCLGVGFAVSGLDEARSPPIADHPELSNARFGRFEPRDENEIRVAEPVPTTVPWSSPEFPGKPDKVSGEDTSKPGENLERAPGQDQESLPPLVEPEVKPVVVVTPPKKNEKKLPEIIHKPVAVKFVAGAFHFAYVKVGKKKLLIEPYGTTKLSPGPHNVYVRLKSDAKWVFFGKVKIPPDQACLVELTKPKGVKITPLK